MSLYCEARVCSKDIHVLHKFYDCLEQACFNYYRRRRGRRAAKYISGLENLGNHNRGNFHFNRKGFSSIYWMNITFSISDNIADFLTPPTTLDALKITEICASLKIYMEVYVLDTNAQPDLKETSFSINQEGEASDQLTIRGKKIHEITSYDLFNKKNKNLEDFNTSNKTSYTKREARYAGWKYYFTDMPARDFIEPETEEDLV